MKRLLSALLTLALVISLIPAVFAENAAPAEQKYEFTSPGSNTSFFANSDITGYKLHRPIDGTDYYINKTYSEYAEDGSRNWRIFDASDGNIKSSTSGFSFGMHKTYNTITVNCRDIGSADFALALKTEQTGFYIPEISLSSSDKTSGLKLTWFISKAEDEDYKGTDKRVLSVQNVLDTDNNTPDLFTADTVIYTQADKELVTAVTTNSKLNFRFWGINLKPVVDPEIKITAEAADVGVITLNTTDNTTATITAKVDGPDLSAPLSVAGGFVEYKSSDTAVVTVDAATGAITAVGEGDAKITAQSPDGAVVSNEITVTVTAPAEPEEDKELVAAFTPDSTDDITDSYAAPTVAGLTANGAIRPVANGDGTYKITADETKDGAKFLYWAKGMTTQKKIISFSNVIEKYVPEEDGRNFLIAVYEGEEPQSDEYYNANGQLIPGANQETRVSMAGYRTSNGWDRYMNTNIYVAHYEQTKPASDISITVTNGTGSGIYAYGDTVTCVADSIENFKCWKKNGEIVSRDTTYTFKAWEGCEIIAVNEEHIYNGEEKKILIDSFAAGDEIGVMAEFIGYSDAVEKGIIFNDGTKETKISMTKPGDQFSVIADAEGTYIGYAILRKGDVYTLITDGLFTK